MTTRGRRRSSRRRSASLWKQALDRVPAGAATELAFAIVLVLGLILMATGGSKYIIVGATACILGGAVLAWQSRVRWTRIQDERQRRVAAEIQTEKRRVRRERDSEEQEVRQRRAATDSAAHKRAKDIQEALRQKERDETAAERRYRRGREEAIARDAMRLLTMSEISLLDACAEAFETRGFIVGRDSDDARRDLLLRGEDGEVRIVARLAPLGRKVEPPDVDAVEAWRGETGAAAGILIGINGFTPDAVRHASELPITLAEAYLLAQWRVGGSLDGKMPEAAAETIERD